MLDKQQLANRFISALKASPLLFEGEILDEQLIRRALNGNVCQQGLLSIKSSFLKHKKLDYGNKYQFIARFDGFNGVGSFFVKGDETDVVYVYDHNTVNTWYRKGYVGVIAPSINLFLKGAREHDIPLPLDWIKTKSAQALERQAQRLNMDFSNSIAKCIENKVNDLLGSKRITVWATSEGINWHLNGSFATNVDAYNVPQSECEIDDLALEIAEFVSSF